MTETATVFGTGVRLAGIHAEPRGRRRGTGLVAVNSGIVHRVGANRLTVDLCRHLAHAGYHSLRFDMSGLGDSPGRADSLPWEQSAPAEIVMAVDELLGRGVATPVLFGNCGGAAKGFWAAERDGRVRGLAFTNPPPNPGEAAAPPGQGTADRLARLLDRGVRTLFVFADGDPGMLFYQAKLAPDLAPFRRSGMLTVFTVARSNHSFATAPATASLLATVLAWMQAYFPADAA